MSKVLVFLQNAWKHGAQPEQRQWLVDETPEVSRDFWEKALWASPTGERLKWMLPKSCEIRVGNASPLIGDNSRSKFPMDPLHVIAQIEEWQPRVVVLLGKESQKARSTVEAFNLGIVDGPHPAYRVFSRRWGLVIRQKIIASINEQAAQAMQERGKNNAIRNRTS